MVKEQEIINIFNILEKRSINYVVMRATYEGVLNEIGDIDLLVLNKKQGKAIDNIFVTSNFIKVKNANDSGYFYKKLTKEGLINFHIQHHICFRSSNQKIVYKEVREVLEDNILKVNNIRFLNEEINAILYLAKMKYENAEYKNKYKKCIKSVFPDNCLSDLYKKLDNFEKDHVQKKRRKNFVTLRRIVYKLKIICRNIFNNNNIVIQGVDGTGKSSTILELSKIMGRNVSVQYMGRKHWETKFATRRFQKKKKGNLSPILNIISLYVEMFKRVSKNLTKNRVIIYDRYPSEIYLQEKGIKKKVLKILFETLFFKPKYSFYLTCPIDVSVERKSDITSAELVEKLKKKKLSFDQYIRMKNKARVLDTYTLSQDEVINMIILSLPKEFVKNL